MSPESKIYIAGHRGLVGSALVKVLKVIVSFLNLHIQKLNYGFSLALSQCYSELQLAHFKYKSNEYSLLYFYWENKKSFF